MKNLYLAALAVAACIPGYAVTPPTLISHNSSVYNTSSDKSVTPTSGWQAGDVIVVVAVDEGVSTETIGAPAASGLTFTPVITHAASSNSSLIVYTAVAGSSGSGAITVSDPTAQFGISVFVFRGSDGVGNHAGSFTSSRTVSLTPAAADSAIVWVVGDWAAAAVQLETPTATIDEVQAQSSGRYTAYVKELADQASTGAVSYGVLGSGTGPFSIGVIEIKGAAGGGGPPAASGLTKRQKLKKLDPAGIDE